MSNSGVNLPRPVTVPQSIEPPTPSGTYHVDSNVLRAFPGDEELVGAQNYGASLWGKSAKIEVKLKSGAAKAYFLKTVDLGDHGRTMSRGEFAALAEIDKIVPGAVPRPIAWGSFAEHPSVSFLLMEFRAVTKQAQPASPDKLPLLLAKLHQDSVSPTGKFGFAVPVCHGKVVQAIDGWEDSWCTLFSRHLGHVIALAKPIFQWPTFDAVSDLLMQKVVPRLLLPLQQGPNPIKPVLLHGDPWDGNTALGDDGEAFVFDACSFYGHNEYDIGDWRAPRHRVSQPDYVEAYKRIIPPSPPEDEWAARNVLYSLPFNITNALHIPGSLQKPIVYKDMLELCREFASENLTSIISEERKNLKERE